MKVTAGVIRKEGKVLLAKRKDTCPWQPGRWEFPGGKIEERESAEECLVREIKEELGVEIEVKKHLMTIPHTYTKGKERLDIELMIYLADWKKGEVKNIEVKDSRWVEKIEWEKMVEADKGVRGRI